MAYPPVYPSRNIDMGAVPQSLVSECITWQYTYDALSEGNKLSMAHLIYSLNHQFYKSLIKSLNSQPHQNLNNSIY